MPYLYLKEISFIRRKMLGIWRMDVSSSVSIAQVLDEKWKNICCKSEMGKFLCPDFIHLIDVFDLHRD